ncbi:hypothetical protein SEA_STARPLATINUM_266 [Streptomyces phage StarPlatinum]|uniref:Uncharacterized protein n=1 Tax=Streptomyces phage StarPlatinum TaxID=2283265 RepID=A0A345M8Z8_9CAUD|nr:hypothetical protein HWB77_gp067 [Streptomyces phage StarPlatinum]AXH66969.1 hypothetical protein SEA_STARPLATINUM_266 [Streptomyces phage StarPlatinum]
MKIGIEVKTLNKNTFFSDLLDLSGKTDDEREKVVNIIEDVLDGVASGSGIGIKVGGKQIAIPSSAIEYATTYEAD